MNRQNEMSFGTTSSGILKQPLLASLLDAKVEVVGPATTHLVGWGAKPNTKKSRSYAMRANLPFWALEDGFLRSYGTGDKFPPMSLVVDHIGIYYDSTRPSALETLLNSEADVLAGMDGSVQRARRNMLAHRLSKYNHAANFCAEALREHDVHRVLVIDQTAGDMSVALGGANAQAFREMLKAALTENAGATVYIKTHPEVSAGRKGGYLTDVQEDERVVMLRKPMNPLSLIEQMDRVYVVSSTMGFEALLAGKPVVCFGVPWYAGWGVTDDRCTQTTAWARRTRKRTVEELFAAAYFHYTRYLNPLTHERGSIFDVIHWLVNQKRMAQATQGAQGRTLAVGFRRWKAASLKPMLGLDASRVHFVPTAQAAERLAPGPDDRLLFWGRTPPPGVAELAERTQAKLVRMEDGFARSVGLGSDLIRPHSLVLDSSGLYFDPSQPSDLEQLLGNQVFSADDLQRAQEVRGFIVHHGLTKYNLEPRQPVQWASGGKRVLLIPGQVEDDASIRFGCTTVKTNLALLQAAREAQPGAFIVYKPHPDVASGNRRGRVALQAARQWADHVEVDVSVVSCIEACDEVHTMTSLTGFDALLRDKHVVTYGQPFYAGWGLTQDRAGEGGASTPAFERRTRQLSLDELVAGTLLHYPLYWDWKLNGYTTCEAVLNTLLAERSALEASTGLASLRTGWLRRQGRKLHALWNAWTCPL